MKNILVAVVLSFAAAIFAPSAGAQQCTVKPAVIPLGQTVRLRCEFHDELSAANAHLNSGPTGRTVRLFKQASGEWQGLMPVAVADSPGTYPIEFLAADGATFATVHLTIRNTMFPPQNVSLAPQIEALHSTSEEMKT